MLYIERSFQSSSKDFSQHLEDILSLEVPRRVINPFCKNWQSIYLQVQEETIELPINELLKANFKDGELRFGLYMYILYLSFG